MDVREHYRRNISHLQYKFEWDVRRLKAEKERLDLKILIDSDVIGMTTTGKKVTVERKKINKATLFIHGLILKLDACRPCCRNKHQKRIILLF